MRHLFTLVSAFLFGAMVHGVEVSSERFSDQQKAATSSLSDAAAPPPPKVEFETEPHDSALTSATFRFSAVSDHALGFYSEAALSLASYRLPEARAPPSYL